MLLRICIDESEFTVNMIKYVELIFFHDPFMPGASMRNPAHGKGHEEGSPTKRKGVIQLQGFPLGFPEHLPPKTRVGLILLYCAFHSSDIL